MVVLGGWGFLMSEVPLYKPVNFRAKIVFARISWLVSVRSPATRRTTILPSKVNLPRAINFRALRGANLVTYPPELWGNETFELHRVACNKLTTPSTFLRLFVLLESEFQVLESDFQDKKSAGT